MQVNEVTEHGFSCHSRRPAECRVCKLPAARHAQAEASEAHSVSMWRTMRNPLVTDRMKTYSDRTLNILRRIADLGGKFDSWDRGNRGWHKTAVSILEKDGIFTRVNDGEAPGLFILTDTGRQACAWHGITIKTITTGADRPDDSRTAQVVDAYRAKHRITSESDREVMVSEMSKPMELDASDIAEGIAQQWCEAGSPRDAQGHPVTDGYVSGATEADECEACELIKSTDGMVAPRPGDTVYRDRDGAQGVVREVRGAEFALAMVDGSHIVANIRTTVAQGFEIIPAAEMEALIWAGTGTVIEPTPRPRSFRKVKDTQSARRRRGGK